MHKLGSGLELRGGLFSFYLAVFARTVIIPLFYHLAVLDYKPCYSQEPWLLKTTLVRKFSKIRNKYMFTLGILACMIYHQKGKNLIFMVVLRLYEVTPV